MDFEDHFDFTNPAPYRIRISTKSQQLSIPLPTVKKDLLELVAALEVQLSGLIIGWDLKDFQSYVLGTTGKCFEFSKFYDLRVLESYLGLDLSSPDGFVKAVTRLKNIVKSDHWDNLKKIYEAVYIPLITTVIPKIETLGLGHVKKRAILHPYYEIVGHINGRMKCSNSLKNGFNPHHLSEEDRHWLRPSDYDNCFMYLDFKNMEVYVLQWLSQDPLLGHILKTYEDAYLGIWETMLGSSNAASREKCKKVFLPVVFGMGAEMIAKKLECSLTTAEKLKDMICSRFRVAIKWVENYPFNDGKCIDYFGRIREFSGEYHKIRNFVIQSPAALICLHKLVKLHEALQNVGKVCFHLHDGYAIIAHKFNIDAVRKLAVETLQREEDLYSGLRLKVVVEVGKSLNNMERV